MTPNRDMGGTTQRCTLGPAHHKFSSRMSPFRRIVAAILALGFVFCAVAHRGTAMIYSNDLTDNTTAPTGSLANSGWQWVGTWDTSDGKFQGVPIGPHHFLAAKHVSGAVGNVFRLNGQAYTTTRMFDDATTDLRIWEVREAFPSWAPVYTGTGEVGKSFVVIGRGLTRGAAVRDTATNSVRGWRWLDGSEGTLRWGTNTVAALRDGGAMGEQLYSTFDATGGSNECHLALHDSSAPMFIKDGATWKVAGVASSVDAFFNTTNSGDGFFAAIFDARGLYYGSSTAGWSLISLAQPSPVPSGFRCTRVSGRASWIESVLATPLTSSIALSDLNPVYDAGPHGATVTTTPSGLSTSVLYNGSPTQPTDAGSYTVQATITQAGYVPASVSGTLVIARASQAIDFGPIGSRSLGDAAFPLTASASSGLPVSFETSAPSIVSISGTQAVLLTAGTAVITAIQPGNANYLAAVPVSQSVTVSAAGPIQTVPATPPWALWISVGLIAVVLIARRDHRLASRAGT